MDRTTASDGDSLNVEGDSPADVNPWGAQPRSHFSIALLKAIEEQKYSLNQINDHLPEGRKLVLTFCCLSLFPCC